MNPGSILNFDKMSAEVRRLRSEGRSFEEIQGMMEDILRRLAMQEAIEMVKAEEQDTADKPAASTPSASDQKAAPAVTPAHTTQPASPPSVTAPEPKPPVAPAPSPPTPPQTVSPSASVPTVKAPSTSVPIRPPAAPAPTFEQAVRGHATRRSSGARPRTPPKLAD